MKKNVIFCKKIVINCENASFGSLSDIFDSDFEEEMDSEVVLEEDFDSDNEYDSDDDSDDSDDSDEELINIHRAPIRNPRGRVRPKGIKSNNLSTRPEDISYWENFGHFRKVFSDDEILGGFYEN